MKIRINDRNLGIILILPSFILFVGLLLYPLGYGIYISVFSKHLLSRDMTFIGLKNYMWLFKNPDFWQALWHSVLWAGSTVSLQIILGTAVALLLHQSYKGRSIARGLVLFPYMIPIVSVVLIWMLMYSALYGVINHLLLKLGLIESPIAWLSSANSAMISVVLVGLWKFFPFVVITILARLQIIPLDLYEAAKIDGATAWDQFRDITLPQLRDILFIVVLLRTIWMFNNFDVIFLLTGGGPLRATMTLPVMVYEQAFENYMMGRGSAVAVLMFVFLIIIMTIYFKAFRQQEAL
ncbi:MAG: sugar ABC transporter permease [Syntrophobacterales bacterium]|nr:MAG: sugar ABC transporter permease [Syntrophobacterales bacterium]